MGLTSYFIEDDAIAPKFYKERRRLPPVAPVATTSQGLYLPRSLLVYVMLLIAHLGTGQSGPRVPAVPVRRVSNMNPKDKGLKRWFVMYY